MIYITSISREREREGGCSFFLYSMLFSILVRVRRGSEKAEVNGECGWYVYIWGGEKKNINQSIN